MATDWTAPIDAYCERVDASFWSEPVNALSNAAFLVARRSAFARWRRAGAADLPVLFLIAAVASSASAASSSTPSPIAGRGSPT